MPPDRIAFELPGHPVGKGRPRSFVQKNGHVGHYTPEATRSYEGMIRLAAKEAMAGCPPLAGPVAVAVVAVFDVPASYLKKRRAACLGGTEFPAKRPDLDNIFKAVTDAMTGVVLKDDVQIVTMRAAKMYGPAPKVSVTVVPL